MFSLAPVEQMWNPSSSILLELQFADQDFFHNGSAHAEMQKPTFAEANGHFARNLRRTSPMTIIDLPGRSASSREVLTSLRPQSHCWTVEKDNALSASVPSS
jgi:hypothetical protein